MDHASAVRHMCENYLENWKYLFWEFKDLKKAYDAIDLHGIEQMLRV